MNTQLEYRIHALRDTNNEKVWLAGSYDKWSINELEARIMTAEEVIQFLNDSVQAPKNAHGIWPTQFKQPE